MTKHDDEREPTWVSGPKASPVKVILAILVLALILVFTYSYNYWFGSAQ